MTTYDHAAIAAAEVRLCRAVRELDGALTNVAITERDDEAGTLYIDHASGIEGTLHPDSGELDELNADPGVQGALERLTELGCGTCTLQIHTVLKAGA